MKFKNIIPFLFALFLFTITANAQNNETPTDSLGLPGDNLNLYAVLKIFKESETLELFEKKLNDETNKINNLDLDGDNKIDYIRVVDNAKDNFHAIVLQVAINEKENQDVAVISVDKDEKGNVTIQVTGDEELYGKDYIIEPDYDDGTGSQVSGTPNPGYQAPDNSPIIDGQKIIPEKTTPYEVAGWPVVQYMFLPSYVLWVSPWHYHYYPSYWRPWTPFYWHYYYGYHYHYNSYYYAHYRRWHYHRSYWWNDYYYRPRRSISITVTSRRQSGYYRTTYSRPDTRKQGSSYYYQRNPSAQKPAVRPPANKPSTRPAVNKPVTRPIVKPPVNKPVTRPVVKPPVNKPVTRPAVTPPVNKPVIRPAVKPPVQKPATRPVIKPGRY